MVPSCGAEQFPKSASSGKPLIWQTLPLASVVTRCCVAARRASMPLGDPGSDDSGTQADWMPSGAPRAEPKSMTTATDAPGDVAHVAACTRAEGPRASAPSNASTTSPWTDRRHRPAMATGSDLNRRRWASQPPGSPVPRSAWHRQWPTHRRCHGRPGSSTRTPAPPWWSWWSWWSWTTSRAEPG